MAEMVIWFHGKGIGAVPKTIAWRRVLVLDVGLRLQVGNLRRMLSVVCVDSTLSEFSAGM